MTFRNSLKPKDIVGVWTVCHGHIAPPDIPAGFVAVFNSDEASW
ncbi:TPA: hypothetical protein ACI7B5_005062, partial [Escherichia coli]